MTGDQTMRFFRTLPYVLVGLLCSPASAPTAHSQTTAPSPTIASRLVLGSGQECSHEDFCLPGLERVYGLRFRQFVVTDPGGPQTVAALKQGDIDVGMLFSTSSSIAANALVLLEDDWHLQPAENTTPIIRAGSAIDRADLKSPLNALDARITTAGLAQLNAKIEVDESRRARIVADWLDGLALSSALPVAKGTCTTARIGSANFAESMTLAEIYAQWLTRHGSPVERHYRIGNRAAYLSKLQQGEVDLVPEYLGSLLAALNQTKHEAADMGSTLRGVRSALTSRGLIALEPAPAEDKNAVVVPAAIAERYRLRRISDLGRTL
jgi:osmoprotectant transport system substrate-binding protein